MSPHSLCMYRCSGCLCVFVKFQASEKANSEQWSEHNVVGLPYSTHTLSPATAASTQMGVYSSHTHRMPNLFFSSTLALTSKSTQRWLESTWEICVKMASTDFCLPVLNWTLLMLWWRNHTTERHKIMFLYQFFVCRATFIFCLYVCCLLFCCFCLASKSISCKRVPKKPILQNALSQRKQPTLSLSFSPPSRSGCCVCLYACMSSKLRNSLTQRQWSISCFECEWRTHTSAEGETNRCTYIWAWLKVTVNLHLSHSMYENHMRKGDGERKTKCRIIHFSCLFALHKAATSTAGAHVRLFGKMISFHLPLRFRSNITAKWTKCVSWNCHRNRCRSRRYKYWMSRRALWDILFTFVFKLFGKLKIV